MPANLTGVSAIAAKWYQSFALKKNGTVVAWGHNGYGETSVPANISGVVAIVAAGGQTLAIVAAPSQIPRPWLSDCGHLPDGSFQLTVHGQTNQSYTLQVSTNLLDWVSVGMFMTVNGTLTLMDPTAADYNRLFYRVMVP